MPRLIVFDEVMENHILATVALEGFETHQAFWALVVVAAFGA
jgi:hypothetical protein